MSNTAKYTLFTEAPRLFATWIRAHQQDCILVSDISQIPSEPHIILFHLTTDKAQQVLEQCLMTPHSIIVLSDTPTTKEGIRLLKMGVKGYVSSALSASQITTVVQAVANQGIWIGQDIMQALIESMMPSPAPNSECWKEGLTSREIETAEAVLQGMNNRDIAELMHISERTVKSHIKNLFDKFSVNDRLALVLKIQARMKN